MSKNSKFLASLVVTAAIVQPMRAQQAPTAPPITVATPKADATSAAPAAPVAPTTTPTKGVIVERVLVRVNGEIFTQSQLTQRQVTALRDLEKEKRDDPKLASTVEEITPDLLVSAVDELLLVQRGREMGVKFTDAQFKESLDNIKKDNKLDDKGLAAALKQEGLTLDELRQQLEKTAMIRAVQQREIGPSMSITQEEQRQYYDKHKADFMTPMTVTLRELMVAVTSTTDKGQSLFSVSDDNSSKAKIESLRARAIAGEDFATLATQSSESATKANGGLIGPINVEDLTPALQEAVASLQPGGVTLAFRGPRGYQIFKLESRSTPTQKTFETVRSDIERAIRDERLDPETEKMLARLRTQAVIEWKDDTFRQMYEKRVYAQVQPPQVKIANIDLQHPVALAPMAGMTDTAFRRLVKRNGGCGLVVTEMVSSEGLVRGIDRTLEYAEYTEEERPVSIQIFGGDPEVMADAAQVVEGMGADIVDINMGCPVPKIAKHHAGCSLMREPEHAASVVRAMARAVKIPVTVKMRAGWNDQEINAPLLARLVEDAGASALAVHGRTAAQSYSGDSDWSLIERVAASVKIPVFGSGDCVSAEQVVTRLQGGRVRGVLIGRGALRNPWIFQQASLAGMGVTPQSVPLQMRGQFLLDYINLLLAEPVDEREGFRHSAPGEAAADRPQPARGRERWVVNKLRALGSWYTKGLDGGSRLRTAINSADSIPTLRQIISDFFFEVPQGVS